MKKKTFILLALAVMMVMSASVQTASAYFTTYAEAKGSVVIGLGGTHIEERFGNWIKHIVITNDPDAQPVYVRARAFAGSQYTLEYSGEGWTKGQGDDPYYYYNEILYGGQSTPELNVEIKNIPKDMVPGDWFEVVVIYETTKVLWDENGNPYADWNLKVEGGNNR